jgi:3-dehydroquinate synthase
VVGDLTGLAASLFMRGIPYLQAPTTLLAQVDSAIGGKTGVNLPAAKNMLGTFYQPRGVFIDLAFLDTLPEREFANGLAEIVKYGVIEDPELLKYLADEAEAIRGRDGAILERLVARSCRIKKGIVELDETEKGLRRILNFGHTMGHAVEAATDYGMAHGEAVAVGMVAAARISVALDHLSTDEGERIEAVLRAVGLPVRIPGNVSAERLLDGLRMDKKKEGADVHFVLLKKIGIPFVNGGVPEALLRKTIEDLQS